jgi:uncharacterized protein YaaR (DUF327 family)
MNEVVGVPQECRKGTKPGWVFCITCDAVEFEQKKSWQKHCSARCRKIFWQCGRVGAKLQRLVREMIQEELQRLGIANEKAHN